MPPFAPDVLLVKPERVAAFLDDEFTRLGLTR
jgi:hypothetical protein